MYINKILAEYSPRAIITARGETNCISSIITLFCELCSCEYILFMHGELLACKELSFVRFSRMYIWDEHYKKILSWARCAKEQYIIYKPDILNLFKHHKEDIQNQDKYDVCYYLSGTGDGDYIEDIEKIQEILIKLSNSGLRVKIRPHPRWSDFEALEGQFSGKNIDVEDVRNVSLTDSIAETRFILGMFSTVILQAYYSNREVVIDDISNPDYFENLKASMYIMLNKPHRLLSEILKND